ncbi:MAG TPA: hypothetical protein VFN29_03590 [Chiayiivirga sp.]|nr:hypothetical protein [Chiayiivirga sp.]
MHNSIRVALAFGLGLVAIGATWASEPARIELVDSGNGLSRLDVSGAWPDTCPPQLLGMQFEGREVTLSAVRETAACSHIETPYAFSSADFDTTEIWPDGGVQRVRLLVEEQPGVQSQLAGFGLVTADRGRTSMTLETGLWWAEQGGEFAAGPGLGLSIENQSGMLSLSVMGYDTEGRATWHFGAGVLDQGLAHMELGQFEGGSGPFTRYAAPVEVTLGGAVDIEVHSPTKATLWFSQHDNANGHLSLRPVSIVRFQFSQSAGETLLGRWLITSDHANLRPTQWLQWTRVEETADGFVLTGADDQARLECRAPPNETNSPPAMCRLHQADGEVIEFTEIALRSLRGWDMNGQRVLAFRLD